MAQNRKAVIGADLPLVSVGVGERMGAVGEHDSQASLQAARLRCRARNPSPSCMHFQNIRTEGGISKSQ